MALKASIGGMTRNRCVSRRLHQSAWKKQKTVFFLATGLKEISWSVSVTVVCVVEISVLAGRFRVWYESQFQIVNVPTRLNQTILNPFLFDNFMAKRGK